MSEYRAIDTGGGRNSTKRLMINECERREREKERERKTTGNEDDHDNSVNDFFPSIFIYRFTPPPPPHPINTSPP